jgi:hypothetical protein
MQVKFILEPQLRRSEFVNRAQLYEAELLKDIEPVQLSVEARQALADCNPDLPEVFNLLSPEIDSGADAAAAHLWEITVNPNSYTAVEIIELWAKEFLAARSANQSETQSEAQPPGA